MEQKFSDLSKFTDVLNFDEDKSDSQPLSLSSRSSSHTIENVDEPPKKHTGQYKEFRSVQEIDPQYRSVFSYPYFNLVQSRVIDDALYSDKSVVVCAPTGTGKTVVFEMAILKLLMDLKEQNYKNEFKVIYMAPVKAICTERMIDWYPKFSPFGLLCIEVTGDRDVDFSQLKPFSIIITTPEKWDLLTRRWRDHRSLVEAIKLFLIDEVHILNDETRGPVLEAVVSRMKTIQTSAQFMRRVEQAKLKTENATQESNLPSPQIRFLAVSATVSNPEDVAAWLGTPEKPAVYYKFGDECRPVKIKRIVEGYPCSEGASIFKFDIVLNYKLWPIIQKHYNGKPTLIFCNTRKSVMMTAEILCRELTITFNLEQKTKLTALANTVKNKKIKALILNGIGCHHAGLLFEERVNIENAFRRKDLPILITTTTLAMGVNLPAHLVIIKNTQYYVNGQFQEYSISTILQMVGRAGRPQFDTEATAVIMTRAQDKQRYQALIEGSEPLESFLHRRLAENLNSEVALCTISDLVQGVQWLKSTFLYVRALRNPRKYLGLPQNASQQQITYKIEELCSIAMNRLVSAGFVTMDEACCVQTTNVGHLMSVYYLDFETMKHFMKVEGSESLEKLLWVVCESHEMADMHLRLDERRCLNALNRNNTASTIRFPMKGKINSRQMKLNCIIQAVLGCLHIPDPSLNQEAMKIMRVAERVCRALVAYVTGKELLTSSPCFYITVVNAVTLAKCITAHLWENSPYMSRQLKGIGPAFSTLLAAAGKNNFNLIEESHPRDLERIMNKGPPTGNILRKQISLLPKYQLTVTPIDTKTVSIQLMLLNYAFLSENQDDLTAGENHKFYIIVGDSENNLLCFSSFKDKELINVYEGQITQIVIRKHDVEHKIVAHCISTSYVGLDVQTEFVFQNFGNTVDTLGVKMKILNNDCTPETGTQRQKRVSKQMTITDSYKPRKRKTNTEYNNLLREKRRRENVLEDKLRSQKDLNKPTTKDLTDSYEVISNDFSNITAISSCRNNELDSYNYKTDDKIENFDLSKNKEILDTYKDLKLEDFESTMEPVIVELDQRRLEENYINNIINEIENEMPKTKKAENFDGEQIMNIKISTDNSEMSNNYKDYAHNSCNTNDQKHHNNYYNISKMGTTNYRVTNKKNKQHVTKRCFSKLNNYNIIDKIRRSNNSIQDISIQETSENGFCTAAKLYLDQYFNTIKSTKENSCDLFLRLLENDKSCEVKECPLDQRKTKETVTQKDIDNKVTYNHEAKSTVNELSVYSNGKRTNKKEESVSMHENDLSFSSKMKQETQELKGFKKENHMNKEKSMLGSNEKYKEIDYSNLSLVNRQDTRLGTHVPKVSASLPLGCTLKQNCANSITNVAKVDFNNDHKSNIVRNKKRDDHVLNNEPNDIIFLEKHRECNENTCNNKMSMMTAMTNYDDGDGNIISNVNDKIKNKSFPTREKFRIFETRENCVFSVKQGILVHSENLLDNYSRAFPSVHRRREDEIEIIQKVELDIRLKKFTTFVIKSSTSPDKKMKRRILYTDKSNSDNFSFSNTVITKRRRSFSDPSGRKFGYMSDEIPPENVINKNIRIIPYCASICKENKVNEENLRTTALDCNNKSEGKCIQLDLSETYNTELKSKSINSVQDILNKYKKSTKKLENYSTPMYIQSITKETNIKKNPKKSTTKRPFNISDIYKANKSSPDKIISNTCHNTLLSSELCMNNICAGNIVENITKVQRSDTKQSNTDDIDGNIENIEHLEYINNESSDQTLEQIMLNPTNLLQFHNINNDDEVIIPPPPEFSDNFQSVSQDSGESRNEFDDEKNTYCDYDLFSPSKHRDVLEKIHTNSYNQEKLEMKCIQSDVSDVRNTEVKNKSISSVQDILNKYKNSTKKIENCSTPIRLTNVTKETTVKRNPRKTTTKRPFNISDIYKANKSLPDKIFPNSHQNTLLSSESSIGYARVGNMMENRNEYITTMQQNDIEEFNVDDVDGNIENIVNLEDTDNEPSEQAMEQIILNPMKLLQFHNKNYDDEVIIPPPPEFADNFEGTSEDYEGSSNEFDDENACYDYEIFSPSKHRIVLENIHSNSYNREKLDNENVSDISSSNDNTLLELKPTQEVETWALSRDEPFQLHSSQSLSASRQIDTTLRINSPDDVDSKNVTPRSETSKRPYNTKNSIKSVLKKYCFAKEKMKKKT